MRTHRPSGRLLSSPRRLTATGRVEYAGAFHIGADHVHGNQTYEPHTAALLHEHSVSRICTQDKGFHWSPFLTVMDSLR